MLKAILRNSLYMSLSRRRLQSVLSVVICRIHEGMKTTLTLSSWDLLFGILFGFELLAEELFRLKNVIVA